MPSLSTLFTPNTGGSLICEEEAQTLIDKMQAYSPPENLNARWSAHDYFDALIDLDDTVYPANMQVCTGDETHVHLHAHPPGIPAEEVPTMRDRLFNRYGTTLRSAN